MEVRDIILQINKKVPDAAMQELNGTRLMITAEGVREVPPAVTPRVKAAFLDIVKRLSNEEFDHFVQYLIALEYHRSSTEGLWAVDQQDPSQKESWPDDRLYQVEFNNETRGWITGPL